MRPTDVDGRRSCKDAASRGDDGYQSVLVDDGGEEGQADGRRSSFNGVWYFTGGRSAHSLDGAALRERGTTGTGTGRPFAGEKGAHLLSWGSSSAVAVRACSGACFLVLQPITAAALNPAAGWSRMLHTSMQF